MKDSWFVKKCLFCSMILWICFFHVETVEAAEGTLKIAYKSNNPYYSFETEEGNSVGLHIDLMAAIAEEMDIQKTEYYPMEDINSCIVALESGKVDGILGFPVFYDGDTSNILISSEINTIDLCMMAKTENTEKIESDKLNQYVAIFEH